MVKPRTRRAFGVNWMSGLASSGRNDRTDFEHAGGWRAIAVPLAKRQPPLVGHKRLIAARDENVSNCISAESSPVRSRCSTRPPWSGRSCSTRSSYATPVCFVPRLVVDDHRETHPFRRLSSVQVLEEVHVRAAGRKALGAAGLHISVTPIELRRLIGKRGDHHPSAAATSRLSFGGCQHACAPTVVAMPGVHPHQVDPGGATPSPASQSSDQIPRLVGHTYREFIFIVSAQWPRR